MGLSRNHYPFPVGEALAEVQPTFQAPPSPKPEPSGPHPRKWESHLRKIIPVLLPFLPFERRYRAATHLFRRICVDLRIPLIVHLSSIHVAAPDLPYFESSARFHYTQIISLFRTQPGRTSSFSKTSLLKVYLSGRLLNVGNPISEPTPLKHLLYQASFE